MPKLYKIVEVTPVDEARLEEAINTWAKKGYALDRVQFVSQEGVRRPVFAYVFMVREEDPEQAEAEIP